jgi:hypothetical protein
MFGRYQNDRRPEGQFKPDCLEGFLISFLFVDLRALTPEEFASWMDELADICQTLHQLDLRNPYRPFKTVWWLELIGDHIAEQFPLYPGGPAQVHADLRRLMALSRS